MDYNNNALLVSLGGESSMSEEAPKGPLGTNTESASPYGHLNGLEAPSHKAFALLGAVSKRYVLQSVIKDILTDVEQDGGRSKFYRFIACKQLSAAFRPGSPKEGDYQLLKIWKDEISIARVGYSKMESGKIRGAFTGMCRCESLWICPVCQPSIAEYRALEIRKALYDHKKAGGHIVFVTLTIQHKKSDSLKSTLQAVSEGVKRVKSGKAFQVIKARLGFIGSIRALEHTFTERNGHHPHLHELWFFESPVDVKELKEWIYTKYSKAIEKRGFSCSKARGVDVKLCLSNKEIDSGRADLDLSSERSIAAYATKGINVDQTWEEFSTSGVWGVPEELTKHHLKKPRTYKDGSTVTSYNAMAFALHYMDHTHLLRITKDEDERKEIIRGLMRFKRLFTEYAKATFGRAQLYWSKGLKDRFGIYQLDDSEVSEQLENLVVHLNYLSVEDLQKIVKFRLRPLIMAIVENPEFTDDETRRRKVREFIDNQNKRVMRFG